MNPPPWGSAINTPDDEELIEGDEENWGMQEEKSGEYHITLTKGIAHAIVFLTAVGLGAISYLLGKFAERILDN